MMQTCPTCHRDLPDPDQFCSTCGQKLAAALPGSNNEIDISRAEYFGYRSGKFILAHRNWIALCVVLVCLLLFLMSWGLQSVETYMAGLVFAGILLYVGLSHLFPNKCPPQKSEPADLSVSAKYDDSSGEAVYVIGVLITGFITFVVTWIYCIATYGFLLGVGIGWLPSIIVAAIVGFLWPLILFAILALLLFMFKN
jgi:hypothetical protein